MKDRNKPFVGQMAQINFDKRDFKGFMSCINKIRQRLSIMIYVR